MPANEDLGKYLTRIKGALEAPAELLDHGNKALSCFDAVRSLLVEEDSPVSEILSDSRLELLDAYVAAISDRASSLMLLRGVMEGLFAALYYREQILSQHLWAAGKSFEMLHSMLEGQHPFRLFYKLHFESERFLRERPGVKGTKIFAEAVELYDDLSCFVHKNTAATRAAKLGVFTDTVERIFRVFFTFLERTDELPDMQFPIPMTFCRQNEKPARRDKIKASDNSQSVESQSVTRVQAASRHNDGDE